MCKNKTKEIPKLNDHIYFVQFLKSNCEHGNGKRYISKENKYRVWWNWYIRINHKIYGSKCSVCNKIIGEFDFHKLSWLFCVMVIQDYIV